MKSKQRVCTTQPNAFWIVWVLVFFLGAATQSFERSFANGFNASLRLPESDPDGSISAGVGFTAAIDFHSNLRARYISAEIALKSIGGAMTRHRDLALRVEPIGRHYPATNALTSEFEVPFIEGQRAVNYPLVFPKWTQGFGYRVTLLEDGKPLEFFETEFTVKSRTINSRTPLTVLMDDRSCNFLFVRKPPRINRRLTGINGELASPSEVGNWRVETLEQLPEDWRLLQDTEFVIVDSSDLSSEAFQAKRDVLRFFVLMGGILAVQESSTREQLERDLLMSLAVEDPTTISSIIPVATEQVYAAEQRLKQRIQFGESQIKGLKQMIRQQKSPAVSESVSATPQEKELLELQELLTQWRSALDQVSKYQTEFSKKWSRASVYRVGAGAVVAMYGESLSEQPDLALLSKLSGLRRSAAIKRGVEPLLGDTRYGRWLIPGVAQPPVYSFIGLLTLFVVFVGPISYRWTNRSGRLHLMFVIAPVLAAMTTIAMFTYSIFSDGFDTKIRVRQIMWVDGASGSAGERTRATLFAGASPRGGLSFPATAEVFPYWDPSPIDWKNLSQEVTTVRYRWRADDESQNFNRLLLPARTQRQFVWHQPRMNLGGVSLGTLPPPPKKSASESIERQPTAVDGSPFDYDETIDQSVSVQLTNSLPFDLERVVARSKDGRYWINKSAPQGSSIQAYFMSDDTRASAALGELYNDYRPIEIFARTKGNARGAADVISAECRRIDQGAANMTEGVFETALNRMLLVQGDIPPGTFVALSSPSADASPVKDATMIESIRYVWGTFRD